MELPDRRTAIASGWVLKHTTNEEGNITKFKAKVVAKGYTQIYKVDYLDIFAPFAKLLSIKILLAIAIAKKLEIHQMDVVIAFLLEDLDDEIYIEQPEGFEQTEPISQKLICKLQKGIYRLKQSARNWNCKLKRGLKALGFK